MFCDSGFSSSRGNRKRNQVTALEKEWGEGSSTHCMTLEPSYRSLSHWHEEKKRKDKGGRKKRKWRRTTTAQPLPSQAHQHLLTVHVDLEWGLGGRPGLAILSFLYPFPFIPGFSSLLPKQPSCSVYFRLQTPRVSHPLSDDKQNTTHPIIKDSKNYLLTNYHYQVTIKQMLVHLEH